MTAQDKRTAALGLVGECATSLPTLTDASQVRDLGQELLARAHQFQGAPEDQPYFTRTVSRLAHEVRSHGWVDIALEILEWGMAHGAVDGHLLSEVAECQLSRNDVAAAEQTLERARALGLSLDAIYTSLVKAHGRNNRADLARAMFDRARADDAVTSFTYPALISAYASAGRLGDARAAFDSAVADGHVSAPAFTALATAFANVSDLAGLDGVLAAARATGHMSSRLVLSAIRARLAQRQFAVSRRILEEGRVAGFADVMCYTVIITACHQMGRHREAKRVVTAAQHDERLSADDLRRVKMANGRGRRQGDGRPQEGTLAA